MFFRASVAKNGPGSPMAGLSGPWRSHPGVGGAVPPDRVAAAAFSWHECRIRGVREQKKGPSVSANQSFIVKVPCADIAVPRACLEALN